MNTDVEVKQAACDRLFDVALGEALRAEADGLPRPRRPRWALLAAVLVATMITVGVALLTAADAGREAQDREPFDALFPRIERRFHRDRLHVQLRSVDRVDALPAGLLPPVAVLPGGPTGDGPVPLDVLDALLVRGGVRSLTVAGDSTIPLERWQAIAALPDLDELTIGCSVDAQCLRALRHAPKLRALRLGSSSGPLTADLVEAVLELPYLESLSLVWLEIARGALAALAGLPNLESLYLEGIDAGHDWIAEIAGIRTLRWLGMAPGRYEDAALTAEQLRRLGELPRLQSLLLAKVAVAAADLTALPESLRVLDLGVHVPAPALRELLSRPSLLGLSLLEVDESAHAVLCEQLPSTRLERFGIHSRISAPLWQALEKLPRLRHLSFRVGEDVAEGLAHVVALQHLEHLSLRTSVPTAEQLRCLRDLPNLRRLVISGTGDGSEYGADLGALQEAIGPGVDLIVR